MRPSRHPGAFRRVIADSVASVHDAAGPECAVLLPQLAAGSCPRFQLWPLSAAVTWASGQFEQQKASVALEYAAGSGHGAVSVVRPPASIPADYFCEDGMHPNDRGYAAWAGMVARGIGLQLSREAPSAEDADEPAEVSMARGLLAARPLLDTTGHAPAER